MSVTKMSVTQEQREKGNLKRGEEMVEKPPNMHQKQPKIQSALSCLLHSQT